ncbi:MAG: hypothetical protein R3B07_34325 [Polyangiaceae bacterium]
MNLTARLRASPSSSRTVLVSGDVVNELLAGAASIRARLPALYLLMR